MGLGEIMNISLSYATEDRQAFEISRIVESLEKKDVIQKVFYWERDTELGMSFDEYMKIKINESIEK